jgi:hypothetical protein
VDLQLKGMYDILSTKVNFFNSPTVPIFPERILIQTSIGPTIGLFDTSKSMVEENGNFGYKTGKHAVSTATNNPYK